uniref:EF-hand domain-containing protein n=1 Tax=Tetradesmus obliquus TaxID=3088 RepID=A0A383VMX6_TETOB
MLFLRLHQSVATPHGAVARANVMISNRVLAPPPHFRKSAWMPTHETIDEQDRQKRVMIHTRFEDADQDRNGRIDMQELRSLLENACSDSLQGPLMQHWLSDAEVSRLMQRYDLDNSGDLSADEFEKLVNDGLLLDEKLSDYQAAFAAVDRDRSGELTADELSIALERLGWPDEKCALEHVEGLMAKYGAVDGKLGLGGFMALMKDNMLDAREVLSYLGARPESPTTTRAVIHAVAADDFKQVMRQEDLDAAVMRAAAGDRLLLLMAGTTWCSASRAIVQQIKALACAYPSLDVVMLWGNMNATTKELFRDQLLVRSTPALSLFQAGDLVRSTPAFFLFQAGDLVCHFSGADSARLEGELRRRIPLSAELPSSPIFGSLASDSDTE